MGEKVVDDGRPAWARRMRAERLARGWTQAAAIRALRSYTDRQLPEQVSLLRNWKRWEAGDAEPDDFYKPLIAKTFGSVTAAFFPRPALPDLAGDAGMSLTEIMARLQASDVSAPMLEALRVTADRLCCEYSSADPHRLLIEASVWLHRLTALIEGRLTFTQHREILSLAGQVALLVSCVEMDLGRRADGEASRLAALSLGREADNPNIIGWAYEIRAWSALTAGDYRSTIAAAEQGEHAARGQGVAVQLAVQRARAWGYLGDRRQVTLALEQARSALERLPYPDSPDNHFVVDPAKFDFYAMGAYRLVGEDRLAEVCARQVLGPHPELGLHPMRNAEAHLTLGVLAARAGDLDQALALGRQGHASGRRSLPSLRMVSGELTRLIRQRFGKAPETAAYLDEFLPSPS